MKLVLVEAPGKVKNISQYLGAGYKVLATGGHVRSLPSKGGAVRPDEDFAMTWTMLTKADRAIAAIAKAVPQAKTLILATDLDREGEAISWHILEYLRQEKLLRSDLEIQRISFNAITKSAILHALQHPRALDTHLVEAYLARLSLDYLVGFTLSPVLWRKLPGSRSAGRVQSVALRLIVEREQEIRAFKIQEYWSLHGLFYSTTPFQAQLTHFQGRKLDKLDIVDGDQAAAWANVVRGQTYGVDDVVAKRVQRHPAVPFITSSLQQDASRKLGYAPSRTMSLAQKLYEGVEMDGQTVGLITYMRTDSPVITPEVVQELRQYIQNTWGSDYVSATVRKAKVKAHSQEAHEAIRPTTLSLSPAALRAHLPNDLWRLYKLIWDRTVASQMASAQYDQTVATIVNAGGDITFRASGSVLVFDGFLVLYDESNDDDDAKSDTEQAAKAQTESDTPDTGEGKSAEPIDKMLQDKDKEEANKKLPLLQVGMAVDLMDVLTQQHFTQPPARYSEASLIKTLEELGIGRPSTYARILQVLQERAYVGIEKKRLFPKELGTVVTAFLCKFFARYVDYHFTAQLEDQLDQVSQGHQPWKAFLGEFWPPFYQTIQASKDLAIADVIQHIQDDVLPREQQTQCPRCQEGALVLKLGKSGPFTACSRYPECTYASGLVSEHVDESAPQARVLGTHPDDGSDIVLKKGPYGWYVQYGQTRASLSTLFSPDTVTQAQALWLLSLPAVLGVHPDTQEDIVQGLGRFGPYVKYQGRFYNVRGIDPRSITLDQAIKIIAQAPAPKTSTVAKNTGKAAGSAQTVPVKTSKTGSAGTKAATKNPKTSTPAAKTRAKKTQDVQATAASKATRSAKSPGAKTAQEPKAPS